MHCNIVRKSGVSLSLIQDVEIKRNSKTTGYIIKLNINFFNRDFIKNV